MNRLTTAIRLAAITQCRLRQRMANSLNGLAFSRHENHECSTRWMQTTGQKIAELHHPVTRTSAAVRPTTQIPIARSLSPAVSSLKACQTPAL